MNRGIALATGDITIVLSNDVRILSKLFIPTVLREFERNPNILLGGELYTQDTGWNKFADDVVIPYVEGWCVIGNSDFFSVNQFDTIYGSSDFEDVDLSMQAVDDGYELHKLPDGLIKHLGAKTYGYTDERRKRTIRNKKLFSEKWGLPLDEN
jgi:GT2 family glycosyltransferase